MKKILMICIITLGVIISNEVTAQVSVRVNIGSQPLWGPVGYDYVEYYYLPEIGVYYYVPGDEFVYWNGFDWVFVRTLPPAYAYVDLYRTYKVVINEPRPYLRNDYYVVHYASYKKAYGKQVVIKNSNDPKYYVVKGHPQQDHRDVKVQEDNKQVKTEKVKKPSGNQEIQRRENDRNVKSGEEVKQQRSDQYQQRREKADQKRDERKKKKDGGQ